MAEEYPILMPDLGEGVVEGELKQWRVSIGDDILEDDIVAEVLTDKASLEIPSAVSGRVKEVKIQEGQMCSVGQPLLILERKNTDKKKKEYLISQELPVEKSSILATPIVRKWAQDHHIDLKKITGTGLAGRITLKDVQSVTPSKNFVSSKDMSENKVLSKKIGGFSVPCLGPEERKPLRGIRKKIAQNMQASKNVIPHFTLMDQARVENLFQLRAQAKKLYPDIKITYLSFIMKILYGNVKEFPEFNSSIDDCNEEIVYKKYFNFGFATDTSRGLLVPVIKDVDKKNIIQISREIKELSDRARHAKITVDEMNGATITITNIGSIAGQWATPIINPPEVAILGMYRMMDSPVFDGERFKPVKTMGFSITSDHRIIDGALAARFMSQFIERVENPSLILIEG